MSLKKQRQAAMIEAMNRRGNNPVSVLTDIHARDNVRTGAIAAPRKVIVTPRKSIPRDFVAPRSDMGEYSPVDQRALFTRDFDRRAARSMNQL